MNLDPHETEARKMLSDGFALQFESELWEYRNHGHQFREWEFPVYLAKGGEPLVRVCADYPMEREDNEEFLLWYGGWEKLKAKFVQFIIAAEQTDDLEALREWEWAGSK